MEQIIEQILIRIAIINEELGGIQDSMAAMRIDVEILKIQMAQILLYQKIFLGTFLSIVGGMIIFIFRRMFIRIFNNRK